MEPTQAEERQRWRDEHWSLFGHLPVNDDPDSPACNHPIHQTLMRKMNGAHLEIPFDIQEIYDEFGEEMTEYKAAREEVVSQIRSHILEIEEEDKWDKARAAGLILPTR